MRRSSCAVFAVALIAACSSDPTGPGGGGGDETYLVSLTVNSIVVRKTCDEFPLDADGGEWSHRVEVRFPGENRITLGTTAGYPSASSKKNVGEGGALALDVIAAEQSREVSVGAGAEIELRIAATEWDYDILGNNPFPDSRMDNRTVTRTFAFADGSWPDEPSGTLTLQNTGACRVDVNYSFEAAKQ